MNIQSDLSSVEINFIFQFYASIYMKYSDNISYRCIDIFQFPVSKEKYKEEITVFLIIFTLYRSLLFCHISTYVIGVG